MDKLAVVLFVYTMSFSATADLNLDLEKLEAEIIDRYPGLFYTEKQINVVRNYEKRRRNETVDFHGCCNSTSKTVSYKTLPDLSEKNVTLVTFQGRKQYFPSETCRSLPNCNMCPCGCRMVSRPFTALIVNPEYPTKSSNPVVLDFVMAPTFCRCFNNAALPETQESYCGSEDNKNSRPTGALSSQGSEL
uniref:Spaetzle domain-containing protein n=1 Tax=Biomphalaria glabrata TaxID=6526 RepID=A0A2C9LT09_BIOGL